MQEWSRDHSEKSISIIKPTVIFGEENRKNVYSLFKQIVSGKFLMVGNGENFSFRSSSFGIWAIEAPLLLDELRWYANVEGAYT